MILKLMGLTVKVDYVNKVTGGESMDASGATYDGMYDMGTSRIQVSAELSEEDKMSTLCHELFHAWMHHSGLHSAVTGDMEEMMAGSFEKFLAPVLWTLAKKSKVKSIHGCA